MPPRKLYIETYGCQMNVADSELMFGVLGRAGYERTDQPAEADVMLVVGTSAVVWPAAGLVPVASNRGARVIEINPEETPFSKALDCSLRGSAGEVLPELIA